MRQDCPRPAKTTSRNGGSVNGSCPVGFSTANWGAWLKPSTDLIRCNSTAGKPGGWRWLLALSLLLHLLGWGGYEAAKALQVWRWMPQLAWLRPAPKIPPAKKQEQPLEFVMVEQPSTEAPDKTKFYGAQNSRAANPDDTRDLNVPKLNGTQSDVPKTETVTKPDFNKLQPAPQPMSPEPAQPAQPTPVVTPGDLSVGKPQDATAAAANAAASADA